MIPPDANAGFVAAMEDVPEVYQRPHDPSRPLVCPRVRLDETSKQLIRETRTPVAPGRPARHEYERNGTANLFMLLAPLQGWRHVEVSHRRAAGTMRRC